MNRTALLLIVLVVSFVAVPAYGALLAFDHVADDGNQTWHDGTDWWPDYDHEPGLSDDALISNGDPGPTAVITAAVDVNSIELGRHGEGGHVEQNSAAVTTASYLRVGSINGVAGSYLISGGSLAVGGSLSVNVPTDIGASFTVSGSGATSISADVLELFDDGTNNGTLGFILDASGVTPINAVTAADITGLIHLDDTAYTATVGEKVTLISTGSGFATNVTTIDNANWSLIVEDNSLKAQYMATVITLGDMNNDGLVNGLDVDPFVDVLLNGPYQPEADMNEDQAVNGLDVDPFVAAVVGGGAQQIPEPSALLLALVALGVVGGWRRWGG